MYCVLFLPSRTFSQAESQCLEADMKLWPGPVRDLGQVTLEQGQMPIRRGRKPLSLLNCNTSCLIELHRVVKLKLSRMFYYNKDSAL